MAKTKPARTMNYLSRDFNSYRADLLRYAKTFFPDKIKDFSEASVGGMFLDFAAFVGDNNSFYIDHQFGELFPDTAVESKNVERHIRDAGIKITGASPAVVTIDVYIEVPAATVNGRLVPKASTLPVIMQDSIFPASNGVGFNLTEDLNYAELDAEGNLVANVIVGDVDTDGHPMTFILKKSGTCISGLTATQTYRIGSDFVPFLKLTLPQENVTEVVSVTDTDGNVYYEVESLTQDVVFKGVTNRGSDRTQVKESLELIPAPYRFTTTTSIETRLTTLQFGSGRADTFDDDIIPDPSELAIPLYGKQQFSRFSIDPNNLLQTRTLGISPVNTTITVEYRYGGGLSHNVASQAIKNVKTLLMKFPGIPTPTEAAAVRASVSVVNETPAAGGEAAPTLDELRTYIPAAKNMQARIVTREDLLARVYTMPSNFGRVFRAGIRNNPNNPLATQLFIISRNAKSELVTSPDTLKKNLVVYLNQFRLISDAIDILDARVINIGIDYQIMVQTNINANIVIQAVNAKLAKYFDRRNFQIDQPIIIDEIRSEIFNTSGVVSVIDIKVKSLAGTVSERSYSDSSIDIQASTQKGMIVGPPGSIFELKYSKFDIVGSSI